MSENKFTIGLDFGSDSVRALLVNTSSGQEVACSVQNYSRWMDGLYCLPAQSQFRHHPKDYIEAMTSVIKDMLKSVSEEVVQHIVGIGVDTTGSTPAPIDKDGNILALLPEFSNNPNAMFVLWKDHTSIHKADRINQLAHSNNFVDYTRYVGGIYSSEWFWAKAAFVSEQDAEVAKRAHSWVELCDWIPAILSGNQAPDNLRRGVCAAGHKALWHDDWNGLPAQDFLSAISPTLDGIRERMFNCVYTSDQKAGDLTSEWAESLGLPVGIVIAIGEFDCHMGAVGAGAKEHDLVKVIGTSTCDILMVKPELVYNKTIAGICGQVKGSALPDLVALEAGQSAFGDIYAWYKRLLIWPLQQWVRDNPEDHTILDNIDELLISMLTDAASEQSQTDYSPLSMDWHNGRRTPVANQRLKGVISSLNLGSTAPDIFYSLVESTAHGAKAIMDCMVNQGVDVNRVLAIGGIAQKSKLVMQTCADVMGTEIAVVESDQCCALGAAIFASVVADVHSSVDAAQQAMSSPIRYIYKPNLAAMEFYQKRNQAYYALGGKIESLTEEQGI